MCIKYTYLTSITCYKIINKTYIFEFLFRMLCYLDNFKYPNENIKF